MVTLITLIQQQFKKIVSADEAKNLQIGSFSEWDSLSHFSFLVLIEETYNIQFSVEEMSELKSISAIADALSKRGIQDVI